MHSADGGLSWNSNVKGLPNNLPRDLTSYYNPKTKEFVLYLIEQTVYNAKGKKAEAVGGIFKSLDGGNTWASITGNFNINLKAIKYPAENIRYYKSYNFV